MDRKKEIYLEQNKDEQAILFLEKTIKTNPSDIKAIKMLVKLLYKHKKFVAAEKILRQAIHDMPEEADVYYFLAKVYQELKNRINYVKYLKLTLNKQLTFSGDVNSLEEEIKEDLNNGIGLVDILTKEQYMQNCYKVEKEE